MDQYQVEVVEVKFGETTLDSGDGGTEAVVGRPHLGGDMQTLPLNSGIRNSPAHLCMVPVHQGGVYAGVPHAEGSQDGSVAGWTPQLVRSQAEVWQHLPLLSDFSFFLSPKIIDNAISNTRNSS